MYFQEQMKKDLIRFTIQNVPIKNKHKIQYFHIFPFTIQNVPIKSRGAWDYDIQRIHLQYKMFLLKMLKVFTNKLWN